MADLQDRDLDRAIAEAMGGPLTHREWYWFRNTNDGALDIYVLGQEPLFCDSPDNQFHRSLDALRDGPERLLREAGWLLSLSVGGGGEYEVEWWSPDNDEAFDPDVRERGMTEAVARARAVLAALRAMKEGADAI